MPFSADDLKHHPVQAYPVLYAYLSRQAKRHLVGLQFDAFEVDMVVGHVVEQLVKLGVMGNQQEPLPAAFERMSEAQFYSFLNHMVRNKAIDRLRKHHLHVATFSELESPDGVEVDDNPLNETVESIWGNPPFATPETETLALASQQDLRAVLIHCIKQLEAAPHQFEAILKEIQEVGADEVLRVFFEDFPAPSAADDTVDDSHSPDSVADDAQLASADQPVKPPADPPAHPPMNQHLSQNKDHAHKKLRLCLQQQNSNLTVRVALRLIQYGVRVPGRNTMTVAFNALIGDRLNERDARIGLQQLTVEKVLDWRGEETITITVEQMKHLKRYYREE